MAEYYVIAVDVGTSNIKTGIYDSDGKLIAQNIKISTTYYPQSGWAEQNADAWIDSIIESIKELFENTMINIQQVKGMGITGQMIGLVPVNDKITPLRNAIIWLDSRADEEAEEILNNIPLFEFLEITGGIPSGKDVISKILWLKTHEPEIFKKTRYFLDVKDYIIYRLTHQILTDITYASVRGLVDVRKKNWSETLCNTVGITIDQLPPIDRTVNIAGTLKEERFFKIGLTANVQVSVGAGDAFVTPLGAGATSIHKAHMYLGTSGWIAVPVKDQLMNPDQGIGSILSADPEKWLLISQTETAGLCLDWFKDNVLIGMNYEQINKMVSQVMPGANKLIFLPWLFGERSPILDAYARGGFVNLSINHTINDMARAVFEGVALNARWMVDGIEEAGVKLDSLNMVGGGANSDIWMQIFADVTKLKIKRVKDPQNATLRGAALLALYALGRFKNFENIESVIEIDKIFEQNSEISGIYDEYYENFTQIYYGLKDVFENLNSY